MEIEKKRREEEKVWDSFSFLYALAKGDVTKYESVYNMNFIVACTHLSYEAKLAKR